MRDPHRRGADGLPEFPQSLDTLFRRIAANKGRINRSDRNAGDPVGMQIGLRQGLINATLVGPKGTAALQDQRDPLERRTLGRDMALAQQRLTAGHDAPPVFPARVAPPSHAWLTPSFPCSGSRLISRQVFQLSG